MQIKDEGFGLLMMIESFVTLLYLAQRRRERSRVLLRHVPNRSVCLNRMGRAPGVGRRANVAVCVARR